MSCNWMRKKYTLTGNDLLQFVCMVGKATVDTPITQFVSTFRQDTVGLHRACGQIIDFLVGQNYSLEEAIEQCPITPNQSKCNDSVVEITRSLLEFVATCDAQHIARKWAWDSMTPQERELEFDTL